MSGRQGSQAAYEVDATSDCERHVPVIRRIEMELDTAQVDIEAALGVVSR